MQESLKLFDSICNNKWFGDTSIILFLNKKADGGTPPRNVIHFQSTLLPLPTLSAGIEHFQLSFLPRHYSYLRFIFQLQYMQFLRRDKIICSWKLLAQLNHAIEYLTEHFPTYVEQCLQKPYRYTDESVPILKVFFCTLDFTN